MIEPIKPQEELARVTELHDLCVLDTPPEERFDRLTRIAQRLFGVPIALVSLVDHERQWFKSRQGLDALQTPRNISFCGHAILSDEPLVVEDACADLRFADNPLVTGPLGVRFYAGMPLQGPKGYRVGTLCLIDQKPRKFSAEDAIALRDMAAAVSEQLANKELSQAVKLAKESVFRLRQVTDTVPALIAYRDREQRFTFHNKAYEDILNLSFKQIHGRTIAELANPQTYVPVQNKAEEVLRGNPVRFDRTYVTRDGEHKIYDMQYFPRYGEGADAGKVIGFFSLGTDITELKRIDRMKTEFISTVSHELRSPLTSIRGSLGLIAGGIVGELPEAAKGLVEIAKNNCERLIRLINDILDSEKIESGKIRLDLQVVDLSQLVQQTVTANDGFASQHGVTVQVQATAEILQAKIDSDRGIQVLTNLLSNAVKFSPSEGTVQVKVLRTGPRVRVEVADSGPGIPLDFQDRIFQKFSQADSSDSRQLGGTGLGLNISKALVEKMGGEIGFTSVTGAGSTFFFEFPEWQEPSDNESPTPEAQRPTSRQHAPAVQPRILICESDPDVAMLISMMLGKAGFDSEVAHSVEQAFECISRNSFVALTVDLNLSGQKGAAFLNTLRSDERTRQLPVVVVSALAEQGRLQFMQQPLAVSDWLEKPIDEHRLVQSVSRAVAGLHSSKPRILHVEDDADIQCIVSAIVQDAADFEFASTLSDARARLRSQRFDLVLLDLGLGEESGWNLFADIDALDPRPPVIVFSASDADPQEGKRVEAVLVKSHTSNDGLLHTIQRALRISGDLTSPLTDTHTST